MNAAPLSMPTLRGQGLVLRPFRADDAELVRTVVTDPVITSITTVPTVDSGTEVDSFLARQHERARTGLGYSFAVADEATDRAMGQIGLWPDRVDPGRASVGYWVAAADRGRGIASGALALLTGWGLAQPGLARIELYVEPWNRASWRAAERAGFRREGLLREWQPVGDGRRDMFMYARLRSAER